MPTILRNVSHVLQTADSDCLVACAQMVLDFVGVHKSYDELAKVLGTRWFGTPARNLKNLETKELTVVLTEMDLNDIQLCLQQQQPVIAFVHTADLSYWVEPTNHAVVVIGFDERHFYLHDPFFQNAPQKVPSEQLALAQLHFDHLCAVIQHSS